MWILATRSLPQKWQCRRAAKIRRRVPDQRIVAQTIVRHALEKAPHRHGGDKAPHAAAEAEMLARPEAEMALWATIDVVGVGIGEFPPVAVAGAEGEGDLVADAQRPPVQLGCAHDRALEALRRCVEAQRLLDRRLDQRGI